MSISFVPPIPSAAQFAEVLCNGGCGSDWYSLGVFLGLEYDELKMIDQTCGSLGASRATRCLIEVHHSLITKGKPLSWKIIIKALEGLKFHELAEKVRDCYIRPAIAHHDQQVGEQQETAESVKCNPDIIKGYSSLTNWYDELLPALKDEVRRKCERLSDLQDIARRKCGLQPIPDETIDDVFNKIEEQCSIVKIEVLLFVVRNISKNEMLIKSFEYFEDAVNIFKNSANMVELVTLIKNKQTTSTGERKKVDLKVWEFWINFKFKQFEVVINEIFQNLYGIMTNITVTRGSLYLNWMIPDVDTTELVTTLPLEFIRLIGVIHLHIGDKIIYNIEGDGCETIEAAMLQAIKLKNTQAIELLLAVGCSPQVATYNGFYSVTNIVNINAVESAEESSSGSSGDVDHVCILGHNKHVKAILDPTSEPKCSSCDVKKKMNDQLHQEIAQLRNNDKQHLKQIEESETKIEILKAKEHTLPQKLKENEEEEHLRQEVKLKDAEIMLLKKANEKLIEKTKLEGNENLEAEILHLKEEIKSKDGEILVLVEEKKLKGNENLEAEILQLKEEVKSKDAEILRLSEEAKLKDIKTLSSERATIDKFVEILKEEHGWYRLGIFLGASKTELDEISDLNRQSTIDTLLIQLYYCLERKGKSLSWKSIATALMQMGNHSLVDKILEHCHQASLLIEEPPAVSITNEFEVLSTKLESILVKIQEASEYENIDINEIQLVIKYCHGLSPLAQEIATFDAVFTRVREQCSILNFYVLEIIVKRILNNGETLFVELRTLKQSVEIFKSSTNIVELVKLIKSKQTTPSEGQKRVELKVREFWTNFTLQQFEIFLNEIISTQLHDVMRPVTVVKGCICLNWIIPDIDTTELVPLLPLEFIRLIGVIHLHIGDKVIYNIEGDGCEMIEAAMLQAIELKNTRAIELLLAVGCSPQVATYNGFYSVTNIVNINAVESAEESSSGSSGGVDHVCILGHNKHVKAILDSTSEPECSSCDVKKINDQAVFHNTSLHMENIEKPVTDGKLPYANEVDLVDKAKGTTTIFSQVIMSSTRALTEDDYS